MKIFFIADVFGSPGRKLLINYLSKLKEEYKVDVCIANCENAASGKGITEKTAAQLFDAGVDVLTGGNHLWDRRDSARYIELENRILRPSNYPERSIGNRYFIKNISSESKLAVVSLTGQAFMNIGDSPFVVLEHMLPDLKKEANSIFIDFHAESTAEKRAFGHYFDGKVSAVIGTHTHIQTADEEILPQGTAYLTDAGMTGPHDSVIGIIKDRAINRFLTGMPSKFEVAENGLQINGALVTVDDNTGKSTYIERVRLKLRS